VCHEKIKHVLCWNIQCWLFWICVPLLAYIRKLAWCSRSKRSIFSADSLDSWLQEAFVALMRLSVRDSCPSVTPARIGALREYCCPSLCKPSARTTHTHTHTHSLTKPESSHSQIKRHTSMSVRINHLCCSDVTCIKKARFSYRFRNKLFSYKSAAFVLWCL